MRLLNRILGLFKRAPRYVIVEVDKRRFKPQLEGENLREALAALRSHPGYLFLIHRLGTQSALLESRLKSTRFEKTDDVSWIQSGIFWANWLEKEREVLIKALEPKVGPPIDPDIEAFNEIDRLLKRVGLPEPQAQ